MLGAIWVFSRVVRFMSTAVFTSSALSGNVVLTTAQTSLLETTALETQSSPSSWA